MGFGGGRKSAPAPEPVVEPEPVKKVDKRAEEEAAALRARNRRGGQRSLLSTSREEAQTGLSTKLSGQ